MTSADNHVLTRADTISLYGTNEKRRAASKSPVVGFSGKQILAASLSGLDPADARQPRDPEVRDMGVTRLNGRGDYASPDIG